MLTTKVFQILANKSPKEVIGNRSIDVREELLISDQAIELILDQYALGRSPRDIKQILKSKNMRIDMKAISEILFAREEFIKQNIMGH